MLRTCFIILAVILFVTAQAQPFADKRKTLKDTVFKPGDEVRLPLILFNFDKSTFRDAPTYHVIDTLKLIADFMNRHPRLVVEIQGHTDTRVSDQYCWNFSQARAKAVMDTLKKLGIHPKRMAAKGYAETKPLIPEHVIRKMKTKEEQENAHMINRRVDLKILAVNFGYRKTMKDSAFGVNDVVNCPGLVFGFHDDRQLRDSLKQVLDFLQKHPSLKVELGCHTDHRGSANYNDTLSQRRASAIVNLLLEMGLDSARITVRGYGEKEPIMTEVPLTLPSGRLVPTYTLLNELFINQFKNNKSDLEFLCQLNRRAELKVLVIGRDK